MTTPSNEQSLERLIERVKAATGPDRELDRELHGEPLDTKRWGSIPIYTASVDYALSLVAQRLPGWSWNIGHDANGELHATIWRGVIEHDEYGASAPLAIIAALLQALKERSNDHE